MELSSTFSDDQIAVLGSFAALAVCGLIAAITYHFGSASRPSAGTGHSDQLKLKTVENPGRAEDRRNAA